jgi:RHS repeat-associated protein
VHSYNNANRMKTARLAGGSDTSYLYNALGQRVKKSGGAAVTTLFVYDEAGHLLGEYDAAGALVQETVWLGDIPVATLRPKAGAGVEIFYVHTDQLNTPRKVSRPSDNKLRWRWDSSPFGEGAPDEDPESLGAFSFNFRFPGQYFDAESALHYNYFRDYDPAVGRYVQSDPIGIRGGVNTFAYVFVNPLRRIDPYGLQSSDVEAPKPTYPSGAGEKAEEACDNESDRSEAGRRADDAKARGDGDEYCRQKRREYDAMIRYYAAMGVQIPKEPPPCFPFPSPPPKAPPAGLKPPQDSKPPASPPIDIPMPRLPPPPELPK